MEFIPSISLEVKPQELYSGEVKLAVCSIFMTFEITISIPQHELIAAKTPKRKRKEGL
jgi:hypothetical protein